MFRPLSRSGRYGLAAMVILLLVAASFRSERLMTIPPGMHPDVAEYISDGLRISRSGSFPLFLETRPEPMWRWILAGAILWTGAAPFTGMVTGIAVGLLTIALAYRALVELIGSWQWASPAARTAGGLLAASALTSNIALEFLNRQGYRAGLLPCAIALLLLLWGKAWRRRRRSGYIWAGLATGFPVNTYIAGLVAPAAGVAALVIITILGRRQERPAWRMAFLMLVMTGVAVLPQAYLFVRIPDLYGRVKAAQTYAFGEPAKNDQPLIPSLPDLVRRINESSREFYATGYYAPNYNAPDTPFLNPAFALLALIGLIMGVVQWRTLPGVLVIGLLVALMMPAALSMDPGDSIRLCGTFVPLAALTGMGGAAFFTFLDRALKRIREQASRSAIQRQIKRVPAGLVVIGMLVSPMVARAQFDAHWLNPKFWADPEYWLSFPHYYSINYTDFLTMLQHVDHPVYVPIRQVDFSTAAWYLTATAFPNIRTVQAYDPLVGPSGLPDAEVWYPYAAEYNVKLTFPAEQFVLLIPGPNGRNGTVEILPPLESGTSQNLRDRAERDGTPIINGYGWRLGWRLPVKPADLTAPVHKADWLPANLRFGNSIELLGYEAPQTFVSGTRIRLTLYWKALAPVGFDAFNFVQILGPDGRLYGTSDTWPYRWIYPPVFWKAGDVLPEVLLFDLQPGLPPGAYKIAIGVYTMPDRVRLPVTDPNGQRVKDDWVVLENHRVPLPAMPAPPAGAAKVGATFGEAAGLLSLDAYTSDIPLDSAQPGSVVHLRTYWHPTARMNQPYTFFVHVSDGTEKIISQQDIQPFKGTYPTTVWAITEPIVLDFTLTVPGDAPPGPYRWQLGAYSFPDLTRLPVTQNNAQPADRRAVLR